MSISKKKSPPVTPAALLVAFLVVLLFLLPFIAKLGFGDEPWVDVLFRNYRLFVFWAIGYGALLGGAYWFDRHPDSLSSWW